MTKINLGFENGIQWRDRRVERNSYWNEDGIKSPTT